MSTFANKALRAIGLRPDLCYIQVALAFLYADPR
jgi:hypothetical protein